jgi:PhnB protein
LKKIPVLINNYLVFDGDCQAAFAFYHQCLGGKMEAMIPHAGTPAEACVSAEWRNKIMHARLIIGDTAFMGCDAPPDRFEEPKGFNVALMINDPAEAERLFHALEEGGKVRMPLQQTFWATPFGMLVDRFGTPWMINCSQAA